MKIIPNYNNTIHTQPAFRASFDFKDAETRELLKIFTYTYPTTCNGDHNAIMIWSLIKELEKIDSNDLLTIRFEKADSDHLLLYGNLIIQNKKTKNSITIEILQGLRDGFGGKEIDFDLIIDDNKKRVTLNIDEPSSLYASNIAEHLYYAIFSDYGMFKLFNIHPRDGIIPRHTDSLDMLTNIPDERIKLRQKIDKQIYKLKKRYRNADNKECERLKVKIDKLHEERCNIRQQYVWTKIDLMG